MVVDPCYLCETDAECEEYSTECKRAYCHAYGICYWRARPPGTRCDDDEDPCTVQCCRDGVNCMSFNVCDEPDIAHGCLPD
jgi:hypothetical protein